MLTVGECSMYANGCAGVYGYYACAALALAWHGGVAVGIHPCYTSQGGVCQVTPLACQNC
jgi:hypothetical protein